MTNEAEGLDLVALEKVAREHSRKDVPQFGAEIARFTPATVLRLLAAIRAQAEQVRVLEGERDEALVSLKYQQAATATERSSAEAAERRAGELEAERDHALAQWKSTAVSFCGPWAVRYAREHGLPEGHLHPTHYDILEAAGARMVDFTRALPAAQAEGEK
jgi:hypothetical protein